MTPVEKQIREQLMAKVPHDTWRKLFFKSPLWAWRLGMRYVFPSSFACLTTRGRKSGLPRHTMIEHTPIHGKYYIVSGWQDQAHWAKNLLADPQITIQPVRGKPVYGTARRIQDDSTMHTVYNAMQHSPFWKPYLDSLTILPNVTDFVANKEKVYIFEVTPGGETGLPPLKADLQWVTWTLGGFLALMIVVRAFSRR